ncbi:hypothetical protein BCV70DRAFT_208137 [Testicularia cyperi]|uniref:Secreted protein n=1 Tax=Testicularia cyperi TaxID=1882483 RepID=A0A317XLG2_9BASI|nr:hypothetical protein BCV70DRAFT_208137 [Testicularia cyperi]
MFFKIGLPLVRLVGIGAQRSMLFAGWLVGNMFEPELQACKARYSSTTTEQYVGYEKTTCSSDPTLVRPSCSANRLQTHADNLATKNYLSAIESRHSIVSDGQFRFVSLLRLHVGRRFSLLSGPSSVATRAITRTASRAHCAPHFHAYFARIMSEHRNGSKRKTAFQHEIAVLAGSYCSGSGAISDVRRHSSILRLGLIEASGIEGGSTW